MTITIRRSDERGHGSHGWLDSRHTFSFADYYDPRHMGFRSLRVINQDRVRGGHGFPMHPHRDMEIVSYVLEGRLEHEDTMGNKSIIGPGEVQVISGGTGFAHSEHNPSRREPVHFLQIWIVPARDKLGLPPTYDEGRYGEDRRRNRLLLVSSGDGRDGSIAVRQDADMYVSQLDAEQTLAHALRPGRGAWLHVATGSVTLNGQALGPGDGAAIEDERELQVSGVDTAELVLFDLA